jgi:pimeloyl-ACP methyl ester carboxylesterase
MKEEFVEFDVDGTNLRIATMTRQGLRAPIVFLHGFGSTKEDFADIARFPHFDDSPVIAFDAPGCGLSECANLSAISIPFLRKTAERVIAHYGISEFHLVGHSMGGLTALLLAHHKPSTVLSFTNIEGNLHGEDCFLSRQIIEHAEQEPEQFMAAFVARTRQTPGFSCALYATGLQHKVRTTAVKSIFRSIVDLSDNGDLLDKFIELPIPRLFMYGDENRSLSYLGRLRERGVQLFEVPHCGHFPMYANPPTMWPHIGAFIDRAESELRHG